jgi:hypothetical protein
MHTSSLIIQRLARLGVAKPTSQLIAAVERQLAPRVAALVTRAVTKPLVSRAFASTLVEASQGSAEGMTGGDPTLPSSRVASCSSEQAKPLDVAGTTADAASPVEAA